MAVPRVYQNDTVHFPTRLVVVEFGSVYSRLFYAVRRFVLHLSLMVARHGHCVMLRDQWGILRVKEGRVLMDEIIRQSLVLF